MRRLNGAVIRMGPQKPRLLALRCDTIKIFPCSKVIGVEHRPKFCSYGSCKNSRTTKKKDKTYTVTAYFAFRQDRNSFTDSAEDDWVSKFNFSWFPSCHMWLVLSAFSLLSFERWSFNGIIPPLSAFASNTGLVFSMVHLILVGESMQFQKQRNTP